MGVVKSKLNIKLSKQLKYCKPKLKIANIAELYLSTKEMDVADQSITRLAAKDKSIKSRWRSFLKLFFW